MLCALSQLRDELLFFFTGDSKITQPFKSGCKIIKGVKVLVLYGLCPTPKFQALTPMHQGLVWNTEYNSS